MRELGLLFVGVVVLVVPSFCLPLRGDEAWYLTVAHELVRGQVLYRDIWDVTNPGVFAWYAVAGSLFGFNEDGVRILEGIWQFGLAVAVSAAAKRAYSLPRLPIAPGLLTVGLYFLAGYSNSNHLARAEGLAVFPLFMAVWAGSDGRWWWAFAAGLAAGVVILLKVTFAAVLFAAFVTLLVEAIRRGRPVLRPLFAVITGLLVPLLITVGYLVAHDAHHAAADALFMTPRQILAEMEPASLTRLVVAVQWFAGNFAGPAAVAVLGIGCRWRLGRDPLILGLLTALLVSVPVILSQRQSWWAYHWMLPGGLLAVIVGYTFPALRKTVAEFHPPAGGNWVFIIAAAAASLPLLLAGGFTAVHSLRHQMGVKPTDRAAARMNFGMAYKLAAEEVAWLAEPQRHAGGVFVCGDPIIHLLSGRRTDNRYPGWALEVWPTSIRSEVARDVAHRKPVYVFLSRVTADYPKLIQDNYEGFAAELAAHYRIVRDTSAGIWYERVQPLHD